MKKLTLMTLLVLLWTTPLFAAGKQYALEVAGLALAAVGLIGEITETWGAPLTFNTALPVFSRDRGCSGRRGRPTCRS